MTVSAQSHSHVFGPVPSRRLGRSLGVDLVPFKTCTFDCIYCQLGRTTCRTVERREWVPTNAVLDELKRKLACRPDYITLSGSGEPTLHSGLGDIIEHIQAMTAVPVAVLTNGSLLWQPQVRAELALANVVLPSLDAGDAAKFSFINRPHPRLSFEQVVEGLIAFRRKFTGQYWLEVFLLAGYTAILADVDRIAALVKKIRPDRVRDLILAAEKTKLHIVRIIDQYMGFYTPLVLAIGGLVWTFTHDLSRVVSIFIVSCPCAFVLATPTAMVAALSAAARLGILIKNVADLELAARINAFVFDKTGTLTTGKLAISRLAPLKGMTPAELLRVAASAEKYSNHPAAKALVQLAGEAGVTLIEATDFSETAGRGIRARLGNADVIIGRAQWLQDNGVDGGFLNSVDLNEAEGWSIIFVARNNQCIGWVGLQDQTRAEAKESLAELKLNGVRRVAMVSGDRRPVAARVAREIGCEEVVGNCLPQNKVEFVLQTRAKGYRVAVVGDGVNDAPALSAGDIGVAMGAAGSEVAINSATIALMNNDLRRLPFLVRLSRETRRVINQNFMVGLGFVIGGLILSALKYINPIMAAILHVAGSLLVVFNSFRLVRQGEELEPHQHAPAQAPSAKSCPAHCQADHSQPGNPRPISTP